MSENPNQGPMRRNRKTKIVATLGPSSNTHDHLRTLFIAGVDVFRINMSHTNHQTLTMLVATARAVEAEMGRPISVLVDLQGPKLRLGILEGGEKRLHTGTEIVIQRGESVDGDQLPIPHAEIFAAQSDPEATRKAVAISVCAFFMLTLFTLCQGARRKKL